MEAGGGKTNSQALPRYKNGGTSHASGRYAPVVLTGLTAQKQLVVTSGPNLGLARRLKQGLSSVALIVLSRNNGGRPAISMGKDQLSRVAFSVIYTKDRTPQ